jgi:hypothetical protein
MMSYGVPVRGSRDGFEVYGFGAAKEQSGLEIAPKHALVVPRLKDLSYITLCDLAWEVITLFSMPNSSGNVYVAFSVDAKVLDGKGCLRLNQKECALATAIAMSMICRPPQVCKLICARMESSCSVYQLATRGPNPWKLTEDEAERRVTISEGGDFCPTEVDRLWCICTKPLVAILLSRDVYMRLRDISATFDLCSEVSECLSLDPSKFRAMADFFRRVSESRTWAPGPVFVCSLGRPPARLAVSHSVGVDIPSSVEADASPA